MRSAAEVGFRLRQELANLILRAAPPSPGLIAAAAPLPGLPDPAGVAAAIGKSAWAAELLSLAEEILAGRVPLLGTSVATGPEPAWRRDYQSGRETPPVFFRRIPYLDASRVGDHKNIWELNRHQHLVLVSQAFALTGKSRYSRFVHAQWRHWERENPFQRGINWTSSLEVAFRALSWTWIFHLAGSEMEPAFRGEFLTSLYRHGLHLEYNLSLYFSPNTHLLGEALALHAIGWLFPQFPRSPRWRETGRTVLLRELQKQVHPDGGYFEQSTYYHVYALDMFLFHHTLEPLPDVSRLHDMARFLAAVVRADGTLPFLGDDDGGRLFHPFGARNGFARATLATCSSVLGTEYFPANERDFLDQAVWWLGPRALATRRIPGPFPSSQCFPQSGIAVMCAGDIRVLFDAGPFGPWSGGHSHSDTLGIVLSAGSSEILIDPGTYTYVGDAGWRDRFRGSDAHNTIRVNGRDQAVATGPFRWQNKPEVKLLHWETTSEADVCEAACCYAGFRHVRRVKFQKANSTLLVTDRIEGPAEECLIEQFWQTGAPAEEMAPGRWKIGERGELTVDASAHCETKEGWRSDAHASKRPAPRLRVWLRATPPVELHAVLLVHPAEDTGLAAPECAGASAPARDSAPE